MLIKDLKSKIKDLPDDADIVLEVSDHEGNTIIARVIYTRETKAKTGQERFVLGNNIQATKGN